MMTRLLPQDLTRLQRKYYGALERKWDFSLMHCLEEQMRPAGSRQVLNRRVRCSGGPSLCWVLQVLFRKYGLGHQTQRWPPIGRGTSRAVGLRQEYPF